MSLLRTATLRAINATRFASTSAAPITVIHSTSNQSGAILGNIEATWKSLPPAEQQEVYQKLEQVQKRDWKELTIDEKKAGEFCLSYERERRRIRYEVLGTFFFSGCFSIPTRRYPPMSVSSNTAVSYPGCRQEELFLREKYDNHGRG